jgi:hypothetical protein
MKTVNTIGHGIHGKHYYTLIVSKLNKTVFALVDILSQASEERYLLDRIVDLNRLNINKRFSFYHCGEKIDFKAVPKKYWKYRFVDNLNEFKLIDQIEIV